MIDWPLFDLPAYGGLFAAALMAATIVPMQSEALLVGLLLSDKYSPFVLVTVAACGNILGAVLNWWLGRSIERFHARAWFPVSEQRLNQAKNWYHRYGRWTLLLSWTPIIGDPLTVIAGVLGERFVFFLLIAGSAKLLRYLFLTAATLSFS
ncbi:MAG: DedA family protein [Clostridia bacterium]|nr:DedA family protein [Clostridia bacterium]